MPIRLWWPLLLLLMLPGMVMAQGSPLDFGITLPPSLNFATSPSPVGSGARAAGKGFAFIAVADDATAASWNPGALIQLERPEASIVGSYFARLEEQNVTEPGIVLDDQTLDGFSLNYLSVAYPFTIFRRNVIISLNYQRLFDLDSKTDVISRFAGDANVTGFQRVSSEQDGALFTISPAIAVQIAPTFSVGVAFNIWPDIFGNGWEQDVDVEGFEGRVPFGNSTVPFRSNGRIEEDFDFEGWNVTVGFLWTINHIFSVGGVFRSPFEAELTHKHKSSLDVTLTVPNGNGGTTEETVSSELDFTEKLDMDMPMSYGLGFAARVSDNLTLSLDVTRVHWSDFKMEQSTRDDALLVENGAPSGRGAAVLNGEADDTTTVRVGGEYLLIGSTWVVPLRAGAYYDPEPSGDGTDDFYGFTLGSGLAIKQFIFDIAYIFRTGTVEATSTDTDVYQHKVLASLIYHF